MPCNKGIIGKVVEVRRSTQELSLEWPIPNFVSLPCGPADFYESSRFSFCNEWFNMRMVPKAHPGLSLIQLYRQSSRSRMKAVTVASGIKGTNGVERRTESVWKFKKKGEQYYRYFCLTSELIEQKQRMMPNDVLTIFCEMKVPVQNRNARGARTEVDRDLEVPTSSKKRRKYATTEKDDDLKESLTNGKQSLGKKGVEELLKSLHEVLAEGEDSDINISVRGKIFPAHRVILRARSPVFKAMFSHDMLEKQSGVVTMEDCNPETFPDFLEHVYTGSIEMISVRNVFDLYETSEKYDFNTLKTGCTEFLKQNLTVATFCNTITLAIKHGDEDLTAQATAFFCDNSLEIVETSEWQTFLQENPIVGNELYIKFLRRNQNK